MQRTFWLAADLLRRSHPSPSLSKFLLPKTFKDGEMVVNANPVNKPPLIGDRVAMLSFELERSLQFNLPSSHPKSRILETPHSSPTLPKVIMEEPTVVDRAWSSEEPQKVLEMPGSELNPDAVYAHRLIVIRRRKMKVHRRRRRWKRFGTRYRKQRLLYQRKRETAFRADLVERIREAKTFNAPQHVEDYLKDLHEPLIPLTIRGKRLPQWLILELTEKHRLEEEREKQLKLDIITKKPLVNPKETVEMFVKRIQSERNNLSQS